MDYRGTPMRLTLQNASDEGIYEAYGCHAGTGAHEDVLVFASHTTSHMDALCHVYGQDQHYNGFSKEAMKTHTGASRLGIEKVGAIAGGPCCWTWWPTPAPMAGWRQARRSAVPTWPPAPRPRAPRYALATSC